MYSLSFSVFRGFLLTAVFAVAASAGAAEGKALYTSKCQGCHGPAGEGKDAIAKMFKVTLTPLSAAAIQAKSDADLKKVITAGHGKMKPITGLSDAQVADIIAHVRTLKK